MTGGAYQRGDDDAQWYALRVQPQKEYVVAYMLRQHDIRTFVPTDTHFRRRTRYAKQKAEFASPVIPGCVFAGFAGVPLWYNVLRNHLIVGPEGMDGHPWRLDVAKLHEFFARQIDGCMVLDKGQRLVYIQGNSGSRAIRAPTTQVKTITKRKAGPKPIVAEASGRRAALLEQFRLSAGHTEPLEQIREVA